MCIKNAYFSDDLLLSHLNHLTVEEWVQYDKPATITADKYFNDLHIKGDLNVVSGHTIQVCGPSSSTFESNLGYSLVKLVLFKRF